MVISMCQLILPKNLSDTPVLGDFSYFRFFYYQDNVVLFVKVLSLLVLLVKCAK